MRRGRTAIAAIGLVALGASVLSPSAPARAAFDNPWTDVTWTAPAAASPDGIAVAGGGVWRTADGSLLALWIPADDDSTVGFENDAVFSSVRPVGQAWSAPAQITDFSRYSSYTAGFSWAVNDAGAAVVTWKQYDVGASEWRLRATTRPAAGGWSAPVTIAGPGGPVGDTSSSLSGQAAVGPSGQATVVFVAKEPTKSLGDASEDNEVYRVDWSGSSWGAPEEVSVEGDLHPIICTEPDPKNCPDREGSASDPAVAYDGAGTAWIAWLHQAASGEPEEDGGVYLLGDGRYLIANSSEASPKRFERLLVAGDPSGGVAVAWARTTSGMELNHREAFAHYRDGSGSVSGRIVQDASLKPVLKSVAARDGRAVVVLGVGEPNSPYDARATWTSRLPAGGSWPAAAPLAESREGGEFARETRAVLTAAGQPVVAYRTHNEPASASGRVTTPASTGWVSQSLTFPVKMTLLTNFQLSGGVLFGSWTALDPDTAARRLYYAGSDGVPTAVSPPPPVPTPSVTSPGGASSTVHPVTLAKQAIRWKAVAVASYDVRYRSAPWNGGFGGYVRPAAWQGLTVTSASHSVPRGQTACYSVRGRAADGRLGAWSAERCTIAPLDQTAMTKSSGWKKKSGSAYYGGSTFQTSRKGAVLTRKGAKLKRVGVVATTCPACGKVAVFVGSQRIGKIDLARGTKTRHRVVLLLPAFSLRSGTVKVKVLSSRKPVAVDGLVVGAR